MNRWHLQALLNILDFLIRFLLKSVCWPTVIDPRFQSNLRNPIALSDRNHYVRELLQARLLLLPPQELVSR